MSHALVYWTEENRYSVVSTKKISYDESDCPSTTDLIGRTFKVKWKSSHFDAEIKATGTKVEMREQEGFWEKIASELSFNEDEVQLASEPSKKRRRQSKQLEISQEVEAPFQPLVAANIELIGVPALNRSNASLVLVGDTETQDLAAPIVPNGSAAAIAPNGSAETVENLKILLQQKVDELAKAKSKNKLLRRNLKKSCGVETVDGQIEIGEGVKILKGFDDFIKGSFTQNPSIFLRRLVFDGGVISLEEVAASSISGTKTVQSPKSPRPALNPLKFKVLKDYTIKCCNLTPNTLDMLKFESKIRSICTDARKKLNQRSELKNIQMSYENDVIQANLGLINIK